MMFGSEMHFVEVGFCFGAVCMAGIRDADPVLVDLQWFLKRLLIPEVQMLLRFWSLQEIS